MKKAILITGVSSGFGNALAEYYLRQNWRVFGISRRSPTRLLKNKNFHFVALDLRQFEKISAVISTFRELNSQLDLLILNAGILGEIKDMKDCSLAYLKNIMDINLWANKILCDEVLAQFNPLRQVIAISSGASINGTHGWNGYSLSKSSLNMLLKLYAKEFPETHFCSLAPGLIDTTMQDYLCQVPNPQKYTALNKLIKARGTDVMPTPAIAVDKIVRFFPKLFDFESGNYVDVRTL